MGEFNAEMDIDGGKITKCHLAGDFFPLQDGLDEVLTRALAGISDDSASITAALKDIHPEEYVSGLELDSLLKIICG